MLVSPQCLSIFRKVSKPVPDQFEPFSLNSVNAHPALSFVSEKSRRFKYSEVPRCRLPSVLEDGRDFAGSHGAAIEIDRKQDSPPRGVR